MEKEKGIGVSGLHEMRLVLPNGFYCLELASVLRPFVIEIMSNNKFSTHFCSFYFFDYENTCFISSSCIQLLTIH